MNDFEKLKKYDKDEGNLHVNETYLGQFFETAKRKLNEICVSLSISNQEYSPDKTIYLIQNYLDISESFGRILYSEISNYIFELEVEQQGTFVTNLEALLNYTINSYELEIEIKKAVARIYDHIQLAIYQTQNARNTFAKSEKQVEEDLRNSVKGVEKEYIGILGIFSSVMLACIGGFIFSTAVFSNLEKASIYRLVFVVCLVGLVVLNIIYITLGYLDRIIYGTQGLWKRKTWLVNVALIIILIIDIGAWVLNYMGVLPYLSV